MRLTKKKILSTQNNKFYFCFPSRFLCTYIIFCFSFDQTFFDEKLLHLTTLVYCQ